MEHIATHLVIFRRGRKSLRFRVADVTDENYFIRVVNKAFSGRIKRPDALTYKDGVKIIISRIKDGALVLKKRVYNKSVRQVFNELKSTIEATPVS